MNIWEVILTAVGLAADAFAVSVCKGLSVDKATLKKALIVGLWFGIFQAGMPILGYLFGSVFAGYIDKFDHWIAFSLLAIIGGKMIYEAVKSQKKGECTQEEKKRAASLAFKIMLPLALATSIDALIVGVSFSLIGAEVYVSAAIIGGITLILSAVGFKAGSVFGHKLENKAELVGGLILILIGLKILFSHLAIIPF
jgi:Predicted membrane protein